MPSDGAFSHGYTYNQGSLYPNRRNAIVTMNQIGNFATTNLKHPTHHRISNYGW